VRRRRRRRAARRDAIRRRRGTAGVEAVDLRWRKRECGLSFGFGFYFDPFCFGPFLGSVKMVFLRKQKDIVVK
jgi:hypothetical protein